jgi:hypothetical protein
LSCRFGFLRNVFWRWGRDPIDLYSGAGDKEWTHVRMERAHFYFLLEYLLQKSGYALFNLWSPVLTYDDCHHNSISYQMMGFMYFLMFEFMYHQRTYFGSPGRDKLLMCMPIINYFVDIAEKEWDDFVVPTEAGGAGFA